VDLRDELHAAAAGAPPSRIDLDELLRGEAKRARRRGTGFAAAAFAAAGLAITGVAAALPGGPGVIAASSPSPAPTAVRSGPVRPVKPAGGRCRTVPVEDRATGTPPNAYSPGPVESCAAAVVRLDHALAGRLTQVSPSAGLTTQPGAEQGFVGFTDPPVRYSVSADVGRGPARAGLGITLSQSPPLAVPKAGTACVPAMKECEQGVMNTVTYVVQSEIPRQHLEPGAHDVKGYLLEAWLGDGTYLWAQLTNLDDAGPLPLTRDQFIALVTSKTFTLYP
jgi:hypothetical protein